MLSKNQIIRIIGEGLFEECVSFFEEFFERACKYKILLTRRCSSLYKIFEPVLMQDDIKNTYGTIITDNAIDYYFDSIKEALSSHSLNNAASVVIVDDIIIYGRTINSILDRLLGDSYSNNIKVMCMFQNTDSIIKKEYKDLVLSRYGANSLDWKQYSCAFSKLIKSSDIANTSYIVSAKLNQNKIGSEFAKALKKKMLRTTTKELNEYNVESYVVAACTTQNFIINRSLNGFIRVYFYNELNSVLISPLLVLDDLSIDDIANLSEKVISICDNDWLKKILLSDDTTLYSFKLRLLSLLLSHMLMRGFFLEYNIPMPRIDEYDYNEIIKYNFSPDIVELFNHFNNSLHSLSCDCFIYSIDDVESDFHEVEDYVFQKAMEDNHSVSINTAKRQEGFSMIGKESLFLKKYAAALMVMIDNGIAALRACFSSKDNRWWSKVCPGEQAFRVMNDQFQDLLPAMYSLENLAFVYKKNSYQLYKDFCVRVCSENLLSKEKEGAFLNYLKIMEENHQQISDVMYIDRNKQPSQTCLDIMRLLKTFKEGVFKT